MSTAPDFAEQLRRVRAGDPEAAAEMVRQYEPIIRMEVRVRLSDPRLRRTFDSMDVCQSVLASFFVRAAAGQFDLDGPEQLVRLLVTMARARVAFQARKARAGKRDHRRNQDVDGEGLEVPGADHTPSRVFSGRELLEQFRQRFSPEEAQLAERRADGRTWDEIARELGGTAVARRKQLARALDRISRELGLDEAGDD